MELREELYNIREKMPLPNVDSIKKLIMYILKNLDINPNQAKSVCIQALVLIERIICYSQDFSH
jgi:hypothetical protein